MTFVSFTSFLLLNLLPAEPGRLKADVLFDLVLESFAVDGMLNLLSSVLYGLVLVFIEPALNIVPLSIQKV